jgi:hypothetical protein
MSSPSFVLSSLVRENPNNPIIFTF